MTQTPDYTEAALAVTFDLITEVMDAVGDDACFTRVNPIETEAYDGFIPFTDGGWDGVATFELNSETSEHVKLIAPYALKEYNDTVEAFCEEHGLSEDDTYFDHPEWEDFYMDYTYGGDGCAWFVKARVCLYTAANRRNTTGEDEMDFGFGINDDFEYGRDHVGAWAGNVGTHWVYEEIVKLSDLNDAKLAEIKAAMLKAWQDA